MTVLELPEPELHAIRLDPHKRTVLGTAEGSDPQTGRLALGVPILIPLDPQTVDADAMPFLKARPGSAFHLLTLTASFTHIEPMPFESAWVDITLRCQTSEAAEDPVAWSMIPRTVAEGVSATRKVTLDSRLKLSIPGPGPDAGIGAAREQQETFSLRDVSVEALNEGTARPRWAFYTTRSGPIRGIQTLCLVIDIPDAAHGTASVEMGATIRMRRMKIFRFTAALAETPEIRTVRIDPA